MIEKVFLQHPRSVGETYLKHMAFALGFFWALARAAAAALTHAFIPRLCEHTASKIVRDLELRSRSRRVG